MQFSWPQIYACWKELQYILRNQRSCFDLRWFKAPFGLICGPSLALVGVVGPSWQILRRFCFCVQYGEASSRYVGSENAFPSARDTTGPSGAQFRPPRKTINLVTEELALLYYIYTHNEPHTYHNQHNTSIHTNTPHQLNFEPSI